MSTVKDIFRAQADSFGAMMIEGSGTVSFKLPEYQRPYDWDKSNVDRLLLDCLNGLKGTAAPSSNHHYTFLGTIILASDNAREPTFDGESKLLVDGQQRLTTLLLLACALFEAIRQHSNDVLLVPHAATKEWVQSESQEQLDRLYGCTTGKRQSLSPTATAPFPRLVRSEDVRGHTEANCNYDSAVAVFLKQFAEYCSNQDIEFSSSAAEADPHLWEVYRYICDRIDKFVYHSPPDDEDHDDDFDPRTLTREEFQQIGCKDLFVKLNQVVPQDEIAGIVTNIADSSETEGFVRLLLFASYVIRSVVLTIVEAPNEDIAFDIFDALNTTGEPLTALETLKPHVVRFEQSQSLRFANSECERWWRILEENAIDPYIAPDRRQRETKELVTGFALYYIGDKIGADLNIQRNTLRSYFIGARNQSENTAREFVRSLARMAQFRRQYWNAISIDALVGPQHQRDDYDNLKLCLRFIADSNTSTIVPILARYWMSFDEMDSEQQFLKGVRTVTAFLALRRAATGGTAGIDSDFRRIMSQGGGSTSSPLCVGSDMGNQILSIDELRSGLRARLAAGRFRVTDKVTWLERAREVSLAKQASRVVYRFLLLAAAHNARPDSEHPGMLSREGVIKSDELNFLHHSTWVGQKYETLEHIAPVSESSAGWDPSVYEQLDTRDKIGNLVLLPEKENDSIGNAPWAKKKVFYRALIAKTEEERQEAITLTQEQGLTFGQRTLSLLKDQSRLHMLDPLAEVESWTAESIEQRTDNVLSLAWDEIAPWIFD